MTESIKQEIINNIFENGDKLITGPILQTVLIDMIDDVNVKDQEILSKTGSWDDAVTQIPNLATKEEVTNLSESVARDLENVVDVDLTGYATETWVQSQGYLKEHQDISNLATKTELNDTKNNLQGNITSLSESVARDLENVVDVDLTGYATEQWVQDQGYLKEHQDISGLATKTELNAAENNLQGNITSLSESVARDLANVSVPEGVATEAWVQSQDYASKTYVDNAVSSSSVDLTGYATETWVESQGYLKEHQDISGLATKTELTSVSESIRTDISNLATKDELNSVSQSVQTDITNLSESVTNSAVWKKGTGKDSVVQVLTDGSTSIPSATGERAIATGYGTTALGGASHAEGAQTNASNSNSHAEGYGTTASGFASHAEGYTTNASEEASHAEGGNTKASGKTSHAEGNDTIASGRGSHAEGSYAKASGLMSHAEGSFTTASGFASHAEGYSTITSNDYEHAQGRYNYTSSNQIFSIGTGNSNSDRRNAVSVLAVDNSGSYTSSFFIQNVGGYDGTNPEPGTNDLATVISGLSSGGGSSETLWKKGEGKDSIVQAIADGTDQPTATGGRAVATGLATTASEYLSHAEGLRTVASGQASHAEGYNTKATGPYSHAEGESTTASRQASHAEGTETKASGNWSHAEGFRAEASGSYSHAEGGYTIASNDYEHAQGKFNVSSENQIFSIGAGDRINYRITRRNALSVLAVPNSDTQVVTASFFVQNVGGYDGTNPEPGTNDLATVLNNTETWTFTLEDGSTVTKSIRIG